MSRLAVVAIGGNSLIRDNKHQSVVDQCEVAGETCRHIAALIELGYDVVIVHGNGPQVGSALLRSEVARDTLGATPLDSCVAETQGLIGHILQQNLENEFRLRKMPKHAVTVVTQVVVDKSDPAFMFPSKPIGPFLSREEAERRKREDDWNITEDSGRGYRRVVASPKPLAIVQEAAIRMLVRSGFVVIAVGGGGIPVVSDGRVFKGVPAVIDKDRAASMLATSLGADLFLISTAVEKVALNYNTPDQLELESLTLAEAELYLTQGHFGVGSMGPKIEAAIAFLKQGGREVVITSPALISHAVCGKAGTRITPNIKL